MSNPYRDRLLTISVLSGGRTRTQVREDRADNGERRKHSTDELGNTITEWSSDRQDVTIRPTTVQGRTSVHKS